MVTAGNLAALVDWKRHCTGSTVDLRGLLVFLTWTWMWCSLGRWYFCADLLEFFLVGVNSSGAVEVGLSVRAFALHCVDLFQL